MPQQWGFFFFTHGVSMMIDVTPSLAIFLDYVTIARGDGSLSSWLFHFENYEGHKSIAVFGFYVGVAYS